MKNALVTSCVVTFLGLGLLSGCGGDDSAPVDDKKDTGTDVTSGGMDARADRADSRTEAGTDGGSCPSAGTCGGNIVGTWNITSSCLDIDVSGAIPDDCPTATAKPVNVEIKGTVTYRADLTYSKQIIFSGGVAITFPRTCLITTDGGMPLTCDQVMQELMLDVTYTSVSCVAAGTGCTCTGVLAPATTQIKTGMYTATSAGQLIETESGQAVPDTSDYCIKDSTLTTSPHAAMGAPASGTISATRVAEPDGGSDAMPDAGSDVVPEAGPVPEAGGDAAPDAGSDATPDAGSNAMPDAGSDVGPDAGGDAPTSG